MDDNPEMRPVTVSTVPMPGAMIVTRRLHSLEKTLSKLSDSLALVIRSQWGTSLKPTLYSLFCRSATSRYHIVSRDHEFVKRLFGTLARAVQKERKMDTVDVQREKPQCLGAELLIYLVGEGLANHLITPTAMSIVEKPRSEREKRRIARVQTLEENYPRLVESIEDMVKKVLNGELAAEGKEYKEFSLDYFGVGFSAGHFTSVKMVAEILNEHEESTIIDLIRNPWRFFAVYNSLTKKTHNFSQYVIDFYSGS